MPAWLIDLFGSRQLNETFWALTLAPLPIWIALVFFPGRALTRAVAWPWLVPPLFGLAYLVLLWNALGSALLLAVVAIAVVSLPVFQVYGPQAVNTWVAYFPYVWLPAGLVTGALLGHVVLWRRLLAHGMRGRAFAPAS